ncbi:phage holin family protein [Pelomonas cellulosilytica]|uniref:Phage holin family protein n=1 Tax=Pelomonas cellulosilytica TaxID=2906762 RepID=A0ABS8XQC9_9BURK|nr:phage holin family protein [Pelomonas sp. P8]MCE4553107.1 phage holin family protein [Pelomonas sp. P8]
MADAPSDPPPGTPGPGAGTAPASLLDQLLGLARELPGLVSDRVELLSLELQRAAQSLVQIVTLVVAIAILGVTVWLALWAGLVVALVHAGLPLAAALLAAIGINGLVIAVAVARVRSLLPRLALPATRRHLTLSPDPRPTSMETAADERSAVPAAGQPVTR